MRDCDVGKVRIDGFYNLIIVVSQLLKLEIKVVQPRDELHFRGVAFDDDELLLEDAFDDKPAAVMFQSSFAKQFVEANVLLFIKPEKVLMTRRWGLLSGLVGQFSVGIHSFGLKGVRLGRTPGLAERAFLSDKPKVVGQKHSSLASSEAKDPLPKTSIEDSDKRLARVLKPGNFPLQYYNRRAPKKSPANGLERSRADISSEAFYLVVYCGRKEFFIIRILEFIALWQLLQLYRQR